LTDFPYFLEDFAKFLKSQNWKQDFPFSTKKRLGNLCFSEAISTNFIAKFSSLEISKSKNTTTEDAARDGRRRNAPSRWADCLYHLPKRWLLDVAFSLAQQAIALCLGTSVPATCRSFGFSFSLPTFFFAPATVCQFLFRAGLSYMFWSLFRRRDDCCCIL